MTSRDNVVRHWNESKYRSPNTTGKLRVGFIATALDAGGSEIWMMSLVRNTPGIHWSGCAHVGVKYMQPWVVEEMASLLPVYSHAFDQFDDDKSLPITRLDSARDAIEAVARHSDILVVWGVIDLGHYLSDEYDGRVVLVSHCSPVELSEKILHSSYECATNYVAVSSAAAKSFPEGLDVEVIHNGADESRLIATDTRAETRERFGWSDDDVVVCFLGRLADGKRPDEVFRAVKELRSRPGGDKYKCWFVGAGVSGALKAEAERELGNAVLFTGAVTDIGNVFSAMDCFVLTSETEGCSLAVLEAWLSGVPSVLTPVGMVPEATEAHGELAIIVPVGAPLSTVADAIEKALLPYNRPVIEHAKAVASEHFTAAKMGERWARYLGGISADVAAHCEVKVRPKIVVGVLSAKPYRDRRDACRATWLAELRKHDSMDAVFIVGSSAAGDPVRRDDLLLLSCDDGYDHLSQKVAHFCRWAVAHCEFDYLFKCDDDTFVAADRLAEIDFQGRDYIGFEFFGHGYASGGAGYFLSRRAAKIIATQLHGTDWKEDVLVADCLRKNGIVISHDDRFLPYGNDDKRPKADNQIITSHRLSRNEFMASHLELAVST